VIMAAGTAVRIMEDFGLAPHFMVELTRELKKGNTFQRKKQRYIFYLFKQVSTYSVDGYKGPNLL